MPSNLCLLPLCLLASATFYAGATSSSSGLMRRHKALEAEHSDSLNRQPTKDGNSGLRVHRLAGVNTELHVSGMKSKSKLDGAVVAGDDIFIHKDREHHHEHRRSQQMPRSDPEEASSVREPMFFQMDSYTNSEHEGDRQQESRRSAVESSASMERSTAKSSAGSVSLLRNAGGNKGVKAAGPKQAAGSTEADDDSDSGSGSNSEEDGNDDDNDEISAERASLAAVKDLSDRSVTTEKDAGVSTAVAGASNRSGFLGWVGNLVTVTDDAAAQANNMQKVDSLGGVEDEANYSLDTEGFWLLTCMAGLLFFSCMMICASRLSNMCACARSPCMSTESVAVQEEAQAESLAAMNKAHEEKVAVPPFQAVINSAREKNVLAEDSVLERSEVGGVEKLLSAVAGLPADGIHDLPLTDTTGAAASRDGIGPRERVMDIALLTEEVLEKLEAAGDHGGGYDCVLARPLSFCQLVRLHAIVLQPQNGEMVAPLALQMCVLYQCTVSRRLHAGMPPVPVAFSSMSTSFHIAPCERPNLRVAVEGADVMLFDTVVGRFSYKGAFATAPGHLQDYVLTHRSAVPGGQWQTSSAFRTEATPLEFQECALLVGGKVTMVGELARDPGGDLVLRPAYLGPLELSDSPRVLVSDDPQLYD